MRVRHSGRRKTATGRDGPVQSKGRAREEMPGGGGAHRGASKEERIGDEVDDGVLGK